MTLEVVADRLSIPTEPFETNDLDWSALENELNIKLPNDYKSFVSFYGTGVIGEFLWVLNPFSENRSLNLDAVRYYQSSYRQMKELFPTEYNRPHFPQNGSFFTWAVTDNGDSIFLVVDGSSSNNWRVGIHSSDQAEEELTDCNFTEFMVAVLNNKLSSDILPTQFLRFEKSFRSAR